MCPSVCVRDRQTDRQREELPVSMLPDAEIRESDREFQYNGLKGENGLLNVSPSLCGLKFQGMMMIPGTPVFWGKSHFCVYWLHPSDLCKAL